MLGPIWTALKILSSSLVSTLTACACGESCSLMRERSTSRFNKSLHRARIVRYVTPKSVNDPDQRPGRERWPGLIEKAANDDSEGEKTGGEIRG